MVFLLTNTVFGNKIIFRNKEGVKLMNLIHLKYAVEIAKTFGSEEDASYINGVLSTIVKKIK